MPISATYQLRNFPIHIIVINTTVVANDGFNVVLRQFSQRVQCIRHIVRELRIRSHQLAVEDIHGVTDTMIEPIFSFKISVGSLNGMIQLKHSISSLGVLFRV
jgi:hypothetical protein